MRGRRMAITRAYQDRLKKGIQPALAAAAAAVKRRVRALPEKCQVPQAQAALQMPTALRSSNVQQCLRTCCTPTPACRRDSLSRGSGAAWICMTQQSRRTAGQQQTSGTAAQAHRSQGLQSSWMIA